MNKLYILKKSISIWSLIYLLSIFAFSLSIAISQPIHTAISINASDPDFPISLNIEKNDLKDLSIIKITSLNTAKFASYNYNREFFSVIPLDDKNLELICNSDGALCFFADGTNYLSFLIDSTEREPNFKIDYMNANRQSIYNESIGIKIPSDVGLANPCSQSFLTLNTGQGIVAGQVDPNWTYGNNVPAYAFNFGYPTQSPNAKWINYFPHDGGYSNFTASFERKFCATSETMGFISFCIAADNIGKVYLNNVFLGQTTTGKYGFMYFACFKNIPVNILAGTNVLRVDVQNIEGSTGFIFTDASISTATGNLGLTNNLCCNGNVQGRIIGRKLWDKNCNSVVDPADVGVSGWNITLVDPSSNTTNTTTDAQGYYSFANLLPGTYTVYESIQQGWTQSNSAGPYTVYVAPNSVNYRDFLNCKPPDCKDLFTETENSSECCQSSFSITNFNNAGLQSLSYVVSGGVINSISANCFVSSYPVNLNNTSSGTLTFDPNCTSQQVTNFFVNASSTTADGNVCIEWTATFLQGGQIFECKKTICIQCERMSLNCNPKFDVAPNVFAPVNTDYRKFTIYNTKQPNSQISHIDVKFVNESIPHHIGGGLVVDGVNKVWTFQNSGGPADAYTQIRLSCIPHVAVHGNPANNYVSFNLGVDNTTIPQYSGVIKFKVGYCDGDTCEFEYIWHPPIKNDYHDALRTYVPSGQIKFTKLGITLPDSAVSFSVTLGDSSTTILATTPPVLEYTTNRKLFAYNTFAEANTALYLTNNRNDSLPIVENQIYLLFDLDEKHSTTEIPVLIRFFDKNGVEIGKAESITNIYGISGNSDSPNSINKIGLKTTIVPNPTSSNAKLQLNLENSEYLSIYINDINSNEIINLVENKLFGAGMNIIDLNLEQFASGTYFIIIKNGKLVYQTKFIISK